MTTLQDRLQEIMAAKGWSRADLVTHSGESSSVVSQWLGKGSKLIKSIGKIEAAEKLARQSGYAALWIAKGMGPKFAANAPITSGEAQSESHPATKVAPHLSWEQLQVQELPEQFTTVVPDDAMAPRARRGDEVLMRRASTAEPGAGVLVRDRTGKLYLRQLREGSGPGQWIAHAENTSYRSLLSDVDGFTIVATLRGVLKGWED